MPRSRFAIRGSSSSTSRCRRRYLTAKFAVKYRLRQRDVELLDPRIANRDLGINDRIDDKARAIGSALERPRRPRKPTLVFSHDVEKNVAVDQYRSHSSSRV